MVISKNTVRWMLVTVAIIVFLVMLRLGIWQLDRATEKQKVTDAVLAMSQTDIDLNKINITVEQRYAKSKVVGEYMVNKTFLLDGQVVNGQVGYHVVTPFKIKGSDRVVLINRGWVSAGESREIKPSIVTPKAELELLGRLNLPDSKPVFWNDDIPLVQNGAWQFLELADYTKRTGIKALPLLIELDKTLDQVGGYVRQWRSYDNHWVSRHQAYAFQWFSMAAAFLILCVFVWRKSKTPA